MPAAEERRPNILWICTDQQRFDSLGCYGNRFVRTPNIDALANAGVSLDACFSQSPICTPSRASFLTGRYPRTTRCRQNGQSIPEDELLATRVLADAGYTCGLAGKFHLSACHPSVAPVMERRVDDGYSSFDWSHDSEAYWSANEYRNWLAGQGVEYQRRNLPDSRHVQTSVPAEFHQSKWCADRAIDFIEAHAQQPEPWLFSINFFDPHHPFDPPESHLERYLGSLSDIPLPDYRPGELHNKPFFQDNDHRKAYNKEGFFPFPEMTDHDHRLIRAAYWAMIDLIDDQVGRLLDTLQRTGQLDDTLVLFMSDHGEMLGDHGIYLKGPYFYEPAVRVPVIISWPRRVQQGERHDHLTELVDIAPTLFEAAGIEQPVGLQGHSQWPALTGSAPKSSRDDVYCEYYNARSSHSHPQAHGTMLRSKTHKLVAMHGFGQGELYDLSADPTEFDNLWDDPAASAVKSELLERLCDRMAWTVDPLPLREGPW